MYCVLSSLSESELRAFGRDATNEQVVSSSYGRTLSHYNIVPEGHWLDQTNAAYGECFVTCWLACGSWIIHVFDEPSLDFWSCVIQASSSTSGCGSSRTSQWRSGMSAASCSCLAPCCQSYVARLCRASLCFPWLILLTCSFVQSYRVSPCPAHARRLVLQAYSVFLAYILFVELKDFCLICVTTYVCNILLLVSVLISNPRGKVKSL